MSNPQETTLRQMRKIKRKRIPHDDKAIAQVTKRLNIGDFVETKVDELFMVVRHAISPSHHHIGLLIAIGPARDVQIQRLVVPHERTDPVSFHVVLEMKR